MNGVNETNKSNEMITADKIEAVKQEGRSLVRECIKEYIRRQYISKRMMHGKQSTIHLYFLKISWHMRMHRAE